MSVCSYFPKRPGLRLGGGDVPARQVEGQVLKGSFSVEEALAGAARRAWRVGEAYASVALLRSGFAVALPVG